MVAITQQTINKINMTHNNTIATNYSDAELCQLIEEYITQHRGPFTLQGVCSYVLYWAMEDGQTTVGGLYDSSQLSSVDCDRVCSVLDAIVREGRIVMDGDRYEKLID